MKGKSKKIGVWKDLSKKVCGYRGYIIIPQRLIREINGQRVTTYSAIVLLKYEYTEMFQEFQEYGSVRDAVKAAKAYVDFCVVNYQMGV